MPTFDTLPLNEARASSATGQRAALLQEYIGYIRSVSPGLAGKLEPGEGETTQAIRRRLAAAAEALGKELQVRRSANTRLLLGAGDPASRQASQEPGRVVSRRASPARQRTCS